MNVKCVHVSTKKKKLQYIFSGPKFWLRSRHQRAKQKKGAGWGVDFVCVMVSLVSNIWDLEFGIWVDEDGRNPDMFIRLSAPLAEGWILYFWCCVWYLVFDIWDLVFGMMKMGESLTCSSAWVLPWLRDGFCMFDVVFGIWDVVFDIWDLVFGMMKIGATLTCSSARVLPWLRVGGAPAIFAQYWISLDEGLIQYGVLLRSYWITPSSTLSVAGNKAYKG